MKRGKTSVLALFFSNLDGSEYNLRANVYNIILKSPVNIKKKPPRVSQRINNNNEKSWKEQKQKWDDVILVYELQLSWL